MSAAASKERFDVVRFMDENCVALCVALALVALSFLGITSGTFTSIIGAFLCLVILMRRSMRLDLWIFIPLLAYTVLSGYASFRAFGTLTEGYFGAQAVYLAIYLAIASVDEREALTMRRLCVSWAVVAAGIGIVMFVGSQFLGGLVLRLSWPLGNADPLGIFLVIAWFAFPGISGDDVWSRLLRRGEPLVLLALALTLTMTSFGALAIGAVAMLLFAKRGRSWGELGRYAAVTLARLVIGVGAGIALYGISLQAPGSWIVSLAFACVVAIVVLWSRIAELLEDRTWLAVVFALLGVVLVVGVLLIRANALARFSERIGMIENGIGYLGVNPLFGIGPFGWFELNHESGLFPTARLIHSTLVSTAVELGIIAALALVVIAVRFFIKRRDPAQRGGFVAFIVQNAFDLGLFFPGVTCTLMVTVATPRSGGMSLTGAAPKVISIVLLALYIVLAAFGLLGS